VGIYAEYRQLVSFLAAHSWQVCGKMSNFVRYIGVDYSGAKTPNSPLKGLRAYLSQGDKAPVEQLLSVSQKKYWSRKQLTEWLIEMLSDPRPTLVGIDHCFSFPIAYFDSHGLKRSWPAFLLDFQGHWPTDQDNVYVDFIRDGLVGQGDDRGGNSRWRRLTEQRAGGAKSVFHFDVPGSVAKSSHAGLPWLQLIRSELGKSVHFWPFNGWIIPPGRSAIAEVYPALWSARYPRADRTADQHDAFCVAAELARADRAGSLPALLEPKLSPRERAVARVEGWILGVE